MFLKIRNIFIKSLILVILLLTAICAKSLDEAEKRSLNISRNVSRILQRLLKGYDKRIRPNYLGSPVVVGVTININNINSVSEVNMDYTIDMYLRQFWIDKRLSFDSFQGVRELVIGSDMLHKIWTPDTFLANERRSYFHKSPSHNKFIRIYPDGRVLFSMRLTVTAACPMNFRYFPMDHQSCDLEIESYGFRNEDIQYKWKDGLEKSLDIDPGIALPQFKLKNSSLKERKIQLSTGNYSRLTMTLYFMRNLGYYIIQIYIPSSMIVIISFISFWIDRQAAPARVTLGITTVLTMVTFIWSTNASLPKMSYIKGIDVYLFCCFIMTFSSVVEYGLVSFVHRRDVTKKKLRESVVTKQQRKNSIKLKCHGNSIKGKIVEYSVSPLFWRKRKSSKEIITLDNDATILHLNGELNNEKDDKVKESKESSFCCQLDVKFKIKASRIDNTSRFLFPAAFFTFQLLYWIIYMRIYFSL